MPAEVSLPSAGQGALGIECLAARKDIIGWLQPLVDADTTAACVLAERAVARALAGSCEVPLGAYARDAASGQDLAARLCRLARMARAWRVPS
jgi:hydroxymethylbilane synthase